MPERAQVRFHAQPRPKASAKRSSTGPDSLSSILAGMEKLADDLRKHSSLAAQDYAQRCTDLARRLRKKLKATGLERPSRGAGPPSSR